MITSYMWNGKEYDYEEEIAKTMCVVGEVNDLFVDNTSVCVEYLTLNGFDDCQISDNVLHAIGFLDSAILNDLEAYDCVLNVAIFDDIACNVEVQNNGMVVLVTLTEEAQGIISNCVDRAIDELVTNVQDHVKNVDRNDYVDLHDMTKDELVISLIDDNAKRKAYIRDIYATVGRIESSLM